VSVLGLVVGIAGGCGSGAHATSGTSNGYGDQYQGDGIQCGAIVCSGSQVCCYVEIASDASSMGPVHKCDQNCESRCLDACPDAGTSSGPGPMPGAPGGSPMGDGAAPAMHGGQMNDGAPPATNGGPMNDGAPPAMSGGPMNDGAAPAMDGAMPGADQ
jgi:hypothetical protein